MKAIAQLLCSPPNPNPNPALSLRPAPSSSLFTKLLQNSGNRHGCSGGASSLRCSASVAGGGGSGGGWTGAAAPRREVRRRGWRWDDEEVAEAGSEATFAAGVELFNAGEYYDCHDVLEELWNGAPEPQRSILHGILQCAVGLYHLLHQNHRGAMVELGEGLTKLRRAGFQAGPLHDFEREASAVLEFVYNTQLEHAACAEDMCITMDGSEQSYQLLGNFGAGQALYRLSSDHGDGGKAHIEFLPQRLQVSSLEMEFKSPPPVIVKLPILRASEEDLYT